MAIGTYAQLKTAVASWLHRSDLTTLIPDFISLCAADIARDVRVREMEQSATGSLSGSTLAIPAGFLEVRRVMLANRVQTYVTPLEFNSVRTSATDNYTILGTNFVFQPAADDYQIDYYKNFDAFSADGDTNWVLTNHPDAYLFGSLAWACTYTQDDPMPHRAAYQAAVTRIRRTQFNSIGPLTVRVDSYNTP